VRFADLNELISSWQLLRNLERLGIVELANPNKLEFSSQSLDFGEFTFLHVESDDGKTDSGGTVLRIVVRFTVFGYYLISALSGSGLRIGGDKEGDEFIFPLGWEEFITREKNG